MIKVIIDGKTISAETPDGLKDRIGEIFPADLREGVTVAYVVTTQPASRRITPSASEEE